MRLFQPRPSPSERWPTQRGHTGSFDGIDGNIHRSDGASTDRFTDIEHVRFVNLTLAYHDAAIDRHLIQDNAHGLNRGVILGIIYRRGPASYNRPGR